MTFEEFKLMIEALLAKLKGRYDLSLVAELGASEEWVVTCTQLGAFFLRYYVDNAIVTDKSYSLADEMMPILWELYPHKWRVAQRGLVPASKNEWGELAGALVGGAVEYVEIYDEVVHYIHKNFEPEHRNLVGAIERDGEEWVVRWGFATVQRIAPPQNPIGDIYQLMAYIYFMARGDMRLIKILPLAQKREWGIYVVSG